MATQSDQTNTGVVTTIVVVGVFAMIAIGMMTTAMVRSEQGRLDSKRPTNADLDTIAALDKAQLERLSAPPAWVGERGGKVHIPIERAMSLVVDEYRKNPTAASPPVPPGVTMPPAGAPVAPGSPAGAAAAGTPQPTPAAPSVATPNLAAPDPASTPRVVPPPTAPGPVPSPPPSRRP